MPTDLYASDPTFCQPGKRPGEHIEELIAYARERLLPDAPWVVVGSRMKLGKTLFEVDENGRRIIGKVSNSKRAQHTFDKLSKLWAAGMRPPSRFLVTRPVAWFPERRLLLQEKAHGAQLLELVLSRTRDAEAGVERAAEWILELRRLHVELQPAETLSLDRCVRELAEQLPPERERIERIGAACERALAIPQPLVPSHGDFHPMNIYVAEGSTTAIDLDTLATREPAFDVGYFITQLGIMGFHTFGSFEETEALRNRFLAHAGPVDSGRLSVQVSSALLRSLHYDLCILKNGNTEQVRPFLEAAERGAL